MNFVVTQNSCPDYIVRVLSVPSPIYIIFVRMSLGQEYISAFHSHIFNGIVAITLLSITARRVFRKRFHRRHGACAVRGIREIRRSEIQYPRVRFSHGKQRLRAAVIDDIIYVVAVENFLRVRLLRRRRPIKQ